MTFFVAKGEPNACGPGCSEWIAAEGTIDFGAPKRLRAFLKGLGKRKLPMFLHSPGGLGPASLEMGRMLRERQMTAGVSKTIPRACTPAGDACQASKRSGEVLEADLRNVAGCASACVFVLIGAKVRRCRRAPASASTPPRFMRRYRRAAARLCQCAQWRYLREMQIGEGLHDPSQASRTSASTIQAPANRSSASTPASSANRIGWTLTLTWSIVPRSYIGGLGQSEAAQGISDQHHPTIVCGSRACSPLSFSQSGARSNRGDRRSRARRHPQEAFLLEGGIYREGRHHGDRRLVRNSRCAG